MYCWKVIELEPNTSAFPACARERSESFLGTRSGLVYFRQTERSSNFILHAETQLDCESVLGLLSFHCKIIEEGEHVLHSLTSYVAIWFGSLKEHIQERQKYWVWYKTLSKHCNLLYIVSIENSFNSYIFQPSAEETQWFLRTAFYRNLSFLWIPRFCSVLFVSVTRVVMGFHTWRAPVDNTVILYDFYYGVRETRKQ